MLLEDREQAEIREVIEEKTPEDFGIPGKLWTLGDELMKLSVQTGQLPYTMEDMSHKIHSFMRRLQHNSSLVTRFFRRPCLSYLYPQK